MNYYFIGIKGSGMAALAGILSELGHFVQGSDIDKFIFTEQALRDKQIEINDFDYPYFDRFDVIVIGNAFQNDHPQVKLALASGKVCLRYHEMLGQLMNTYESYSVAGTHGKTTTTGLLSHTLSAFAPTGYLIGDGTGHLTKESKFFVVESCEYKRHFLAYHPAYAIITSAELDHVDYFNGYADYLSAYEEFITKVDQGIVMYGDDPHIMQVKSTKPCLYYGLQEHNDVRAKHVVYDEQGISFDLYYHDEWMKHITLPFVGEHLLWNALGVLAIVIQRGLDLDAAVEKMKSFPGVKRRFNEEKKGTQVYIDDYAHHPTAIELTIKAAKQKYPRKKIVAVFKPDRYSRIAYFVEEFAKSFALADEIYICDFPANAQKEPGIDFSIDQLIDAMDHAHYLVEDEISAKQFATYENTVFLFMSSKDIYKFKDLVKNFHNS